jgi:hypothetical protein
VCLTLAWKFLQSTIDPGIQQEQQQQQHPATANTTERTTAQIDKGILSVYNSIDCACHPTQSSTKAQSQYYTLKVIGSYFAVQCHSSLTERECYSHNIQETPEPFSVIRTHSPSILAATVLLPPKEAIMNCQQPGLASSANATASSASVNATNTTSASQHSYRSHMNSSSNPRSRLSEIIIPANHHNQNAYLSTSYNLEEVGLTTAAQLRQRERSLALAKAEAVTSRYRQLCAISMRRLPVYNNRLEHQQQRHLEMRQQQQQLKQNSVRSIGSSVASPNTSSRRSLEPEALHLRDSFRKNSITSCASSTSSSCTTTTTSSSKQKTKKKAPPVAGAAPSAEGLTDNATAASVPPEWAAQVTDKVSNHSPKTTGTSRKHLTVSSNDRNYNPNTYRSQDDADVGDLYQAILLKQQQQWVESHSGTARHADGGEYEDAFPSGMSLQEEQAQYLKQFGSFSTGDLDYHYQEYLDIPQQQTPTGNSTMSPVEEQSQLWEQIRNGNNSSSSSSTIWKSYSADNNTSSESDYAYLPGMDTSYQSYASSSDAYSYHEALSPRKPAAAMDPVEEQAMLLQQLQERQSLSQPHHYATNTNTNTTTAYSNSNSNSNTPWSAVKEQAQRLREIQDEKEQHILNMAYQMSMSANSNNNNTKDDSIPSLIASTGSDEAEDDGDDKEDLSLQLIMELSRQEAEAVASVSHKQLTDSWHNNNSSNNTIATTTCNYREEDEDDRALRLALERSQQELPWIADTGSADAAAATAGCGSVDEEEEQVELVKRVSREASMDLELRRSIAELVCRRQESSGSSTSGAF